MGPARLAAIRFFGRLVGPTAMGTILLAAGVGAVQALVVAGLLGLMFHYEAIIQ